MDSREKALYIANLAKDKKAEDVVVLEIKRLSSIADYIVICSGTSDRQVKAVVESIEHGLKKKRIIPIGEEGIGEGRWALIDYGDVIVHIFYEPVRYFYDLEGFWADARRIAV